MLPLGRGRGGGGCWEKIGNIRELRKQLETEVTCALLPIYNFKKRLHLRASPSSSWANAEQSWWNGVLGQKEA